MHRTVYVILLCVFQSRHWDREGRREHAHRNWAESKHPPYWLLSTQRQLRATEGTSPGSRDGDHMKQVPLLFCLMSRRRTKDYKAVLQAILDVLPGPPAVQELVMDFERAAWSAASKVVLHVHCQGCAFHWGQAVWRKTQELGLRRAYLNDSDTFNFLRWLSWWPCLCSQPSTSPQVECI